jgi:LuxR family transcriptional regulator, maltose regulon positive regulatory protein
MGQMLQMHEPRRLRVVGADASGNHTGAEGDLPPTSLDGLTMTDGQTTNVVPLFGMDGGARGDGHPVAGDSRSALAVRGWIVQSLLLEAIIRDEVGDVFAAEEALERALELAEHDRVVLPFTVDPVPALLARYAEYHSTHTELIADIFDLLDRHSAVSPPSAYEALVEPLTEGESRVVRYLPTNLSKREIAHELYVSVHTIKTHMKHIYAKLDAHNRLEAVQRAREYGLIGRA